eukprot:TRINITY_DN24617_c0_g1_i1.p2 TRINITY_DN24617_c0_g1~~TRINITY_DN24617_c0_g1_i1.p2  ORF type:complete len:207 (-),score=24.68 TRINITY_DN24617_c0_g1_i1:1386-2006(-)
MSNAAMQQACCDWTAACGSVQTATVASGATKRTSYYPVIGLAKGRSVAHAAEVAAPASLRGLVTPAAAASVVNGVPSPARVKAAACRADGCDHAQSRRGRPRHGQPPEPAAERWHRCDEARTSSSISTCASSHSGQEIIASPAGSGSSPWSRATQAAMHSALHRGRSAGAAPVRASDERREEDNGAAECILSRAPTGWYTVSAWCS